MGGKKLRYGLVGWGACAVACCAIVSVSADEASRWVGAETCRTCHPQAYRVWAESDHNRANQGLPEGFGTDPKCTQCHGSSGVDKPGVQCETCHGSGQVYAKRYVMKDRVLARLVGLVELFENSCLRCHTETAPNIRPYKQEQMWKLIKHGREEKSAPTNPKTEP